MKFNPFCLIYILIYAKIYTTTHGTFIETLSVTLLFSVQVHNNTRDMRKSGKVVTIIKFTRLEIEYINNNVCIKAE